MPTSHPSKSGSSLPGMFYYPSTRTLPLCYGRTAYSNKAMSSRIGLGMMDRWQLYRVVHMHSETVTPTVALNSFLIVTSPACYIHVGLLPGEKPMQQFPSRLSVALLPVEGATTAAACNPPETRESSSCLIRLRPNLRLFITRF